MAKMGLETVIDGLMRRVSNLLGDNRNWIDRLGPLSSLEVMLAHADRACHGLSIDVPQHLGQLTRSTLSAMRSRIKNCTYWMMSA